MLVTSFLAPWGYTTSAIISFDFTTCCISQAQLFRRRVFRGLLVLPCCHNHNRDRARSFSTRTQHFIHVLAKGQCETRSLSTLPVRRTKVFRKGRSDASTSRQFSSNTPNLKSYNLPWSTQKGPMLAKAFKNRLTSPQTAEGIPGRSAFVCKGRARYILYGEPTTRSWKSVAATTRRYVSTSTLFEEEEKLCDPSRGRNSKLKSSKKSWSEPEDRMLLQALKEDLDLDQVAERLPSRSKNACRLRIWRLGLHRKHSPSFWSESEIRIIVQSLLDGLTYDQIAEACPGRSCTAIRRKTEGLGLNRWNSESHQAYQARLKAFLKEKKESDIVKKNFFRPRWSDAEVKLVVGASRLGLSAGNITNNMDIGRSINAIETFTWKMGLKHRTKWTPEEDEYLIAARAEAKEYKEIAKLTKNKRTYNAVVMRYRLLKKKALILSESPKVATPEKSKG